MQVKLPRITAQSVVTYVTAVGVSTSPGLPPRIYSCCALMERLR
jgi:hypothetical protein